MILIFTKTNLSINL